MNKGYKQLEMGEAVRIMRLDATRNYGTIFSTNLPITFFFDKDGRFDGVEVDVRQLPETQQTLVKQLCEMLP